MDNEYGKWKMKKKKSYKKLKDFFKDKIIVEIETIMLTISEFLKTIDEIIDDMDLKAGLLALLGSLNIAKFYAENKIIKNLDTVIQKV